jgi:death-on-curing protein
LPSDESSPAVRFLSVDEVEAIHERVMDTFGGPGGVRDRGLLESALYRPQTGYYEDLVEMAAALFESLLVNHPFVDGNKRVAFFACDVFLRLNGWRMVVEAAGAHAFIVGMLERGECSLPVIATWLRGAIKPL